MKGHRGSVLGVLLYYFVKDNPTVYDYILFHLLLIMFTYREYSIEIRVSSIKAETNLGKLRGGSK